MNTDSKIRRDTAKRLVMKLAGQPYAPVEEQAWAVLIDCLRDYAEDQSHAEVVIEECLRLTDKDGASRMATSLDIRTLAHASRKTEVRPLRECPHCSGSGYRIVTRGEHSGAERCDCWKRQAVEDAPVYSGEVPAEVADLACRKTLAGGGDR